MPVDAALTSKLSETSLTRKWVAPASRRCRAVSRRGVARVLVDSSMTSMEDGVKASCNIALYDHLQTCRFARAFHDSQSKTSRSAAGRDPNFHFTASKRLRHPKDIHNGRMNLRSRLFDSIRVKSGFKQERAQIRRFAASRLWRSGPIPRADGRLREGQYFSFCLDHVREYNASYNYFNGMSVEAMALYQREALVVIARPGRWGKTRGQEFPRGGRRSVAPERDAGMFGTDRRRYSCETPQKPRYGWRP